MHLNQEEDFQFKFLFNENDFGKVKKLLACAPEFSDHYPNFREWLNNALAEASLEKRLVFGISKPIVVNNTPNLALIGVAIIKIVGETAELKTLFIDKDMRGKKYGSNLYQNVEEQLAKKRVNKIITDVPNENRLVSRFLIQHGFQINGLIERYKKGDFTYVLSKDIKTSYTGDIFDWQEVVKWFLQNIYLFDVLGKEKSCIEDYLFLSIRNSNQELQNHSLPAIEGLAVLCNNQITPEISENIIEMIETQEKNVFTIFTKEINKDFLNKVNQNRYLVFDETQVYKACGCPLPPFKVEEISGIIVEMKSRYFDEISKSERHFSYVKGASVGRFAKKGDIIIFYADSKDEYPSGALMGYGKIKNITLGNPNDIWGNYEDKNPLFSHEDFVKFTNCKSEIIAIEVEDFTDIQPIPYTKFLSLFQEAIFTTELGNMYINQDFAQLFLDYVNRPTESPKTIEFIPIADSKNNGQKLLHDIIKACHHLQGRTKSIKKDEDSRNGIIRLILTLSGYSASDQTKWGSSATGKSAGEIDIKIEENGNAVSICEAFILESLDRTVIKKHLIKIFRYDSNGLSQNFIIVYSDSSHFMDLWSKYLEHVPQIDFEYPIEVNITDISDDCSEYAEIKVALTKHKRNDRLLDLYHIFVNMSL